MHWVIVVGKVESGWVQVATITDTIDPRVDSDLYIPIHPTPKNRRTNMQLKIAHNSYGNNGLPFLSYLRVDKVYEVPRDILRDEGMELKVRSYNSVRVS
ncbi:hypothetical protein GGR54DRAFT_555743 [Hypoxylon sp. NC1633]|nr:hypothetical protein GGR54DRAFT_555743 [Hypoxylon sp. NC1633]